MGDGDNQANNGAIKPITIAMDALSTCIYCVMIFIAIKNYCWIRDDKDK